jgi:hypothetical protein
MNTITTANYKSARLIQTLYNKSRNMEARHLRFYVEVDHNQAEGFRE